MGRHRGRRSRGVNPRRNPASQASRPRRKGGKGAIMPEIYSRFTSEALYVMRRAREMIDEDGGRQIRPEHLLLAMLELNQSDAKRMLGKLGIRPRTVAKRLAKTREEWLHLEDSGEVSSTVRSYMSKAARGMVDQALLEATRDQVFRISTRHLLLGLMAQPDRPGTALLTAEGASVEALRALDLPSVELAGDHPEQVVAHFPFKISPIFLGLVAITAGAGYACYKELVQNGIFVFLFVVGGWLISLALHEFGHALVAYYAGDRSVANKGYLTLNPLKYTHPLLSLIMPMFFILIGGIGLPGGAVYINRRAIRREKLHSLVAAGGPMATLLCIAALGLAFILMLRRQPWQLLLHSQFWAALAVLLFFQVTALAINLLPLPGLDGFNIIAPFLATEKRAAIQSMGNLSFLLLFLFFTQDTPLRNWFWGMIIGIVSLFIRIPELLGYGYTLFRFWEGF